MFRFLGRFTVAHPWKICAAWLLAGLLLSWLAPAWETKAQDDDIRFLPARCDSVRGYLLLSKAFPQDVFASKAIFAIERPEGRLTAADLALVDRLVADLHELSRQEPELNLGSIHSCRDAFVGKRLLSDDGQCTLIQVALSTPFLALQTRATVDRVEARLQQRLKESGPNVPRLLATGPAGVGRDLIRASSDGLEGTTIATVALVIVVLLLVYRAPLLALVPLATIAMSVWVAMQLLALLTLIPGVYLVNVSKVFAIVILYGTGTDYCLFLICRYREELANGCGLNSAINRSVINVGGALAASAGTVICGLGLMGLAEFAKVRCAGPAIALSLGVALLASLTLAPALLCLLGRLAFWPNGVPLQTPGQGPRNFWDRISRGVVARPALVWSVAVLALLPLAILGFRVQPSYKATGELASSSPSLQGLNAIQRHFTPGETGPITVLLQSTTDWNSPQGRKAVSHLSRGLRLLNNVAEVRSLTQPLGEPITEPVAPPEHEGENALARWMQSARRTLAEGVAVQAGQVAREFYTARIPTGESLTRLDVVLGSDPFDQKSIGTLGLIQTWLREELPATTAGLGGAEAEYYGVPVNARDLAEVTDGDRVRVNRLVLAGIFLILLVLVRRPWLAGYLLLTVLLSYFATLGATALLATLVNGRPLGEVDWHVPFFLFTILVAIGEDYNILLVSRILQERERHDTDEGIRRALSQTGGTITSCGIIMAGTFATLMLTGLGTLVQIGFALAFGVLLDTFLVRPFLVPALLLMVWRLTGKQGKKLIPPRPAPARHPRAA